MSKIHAAALNHPKNTVAEVLKSINISHNQYRNLCKTHLNINDVRKENLGSCYAYTKTEREQMGKRLNESRKTSSKTHAKSQKRSKSKTRVGAGRDESDGSNNAEFNVQDFIKETYGNNTMVKN